MMASDQRHLILATVISVKDSCVTYACCERCYSKLVPAFDDGSWHCRKCGYSCYVDERMWRYRLSMVISDGTSICSICLFGNVLQQFFGSPASKFVRNLEHLETTQGNSEEMLMTATRQVFVGQHYYFGFKTFSNSRTKHMQLADIIKRNNDATGEYFSVSTQNGDQNGCHIIAYQMLSATNSRTVTVSECIAHLLKNSNSSMTMDNRQISENLLCQRSNSMTSSMSGCSELTNRSSLSFGQTTAFLSCEIPDETVRTSTNSMTKKVKNDNDCKEILKRPVIEIVDCDSKVVKTRNCIHTSGSINNNEKRELCSHECECTTYTSKSTGTSKMTRESVCSLPVHKERQLHSFNRKNMIDSSVVEIDNLDDNLSRGCDDRSEIQQSKNLCPNFENEYKDQYGEFRHESFIQGNEIKCSKIRNEALVADQEYSKNGERKLNMKYKLAGKGNKGSAPSQDETSMILHKQKKDFECVSEGEFSHNSMFDDSANNSYLLLASCGDGKSSIQNHRKSANENAGAICTVSNDQWKSFCEGSILQENARLGVVSFTFPDDIPDSEDLNAYFDETYIDEEVCFSENINKSYLGVSTVAGACDTKGGNEGDKVTISGHSNIWASIPKGDNKSVNSDMKYDAYENIGTKMTIPENRETELCTTGKTADNLSDRGETESSIFDIKGTECITSYKTGDNVVDSRGPESNTSGQTGDTCNIADSTESKYNILGKTDDNTADSTKVGCYISGKTGDNIADSTESECYISSKIGDNKADSTESECNISSKPGDNIADSTESECYISSKIGDNIADSTESECNISSQTGDNIADSTESKYNILCKTGDNTADSTKIELYITGKRQAKDIVCDKDTKLDINVSVESEVNVLMSENRETVENNSEDIVNGNDQKCLSGRDSRCSVSDFDLEFCSSKSVKCLQLSVVRDISKQCDSFCFDSMLDVIKDSFAMNGSAELFQSLTPCKELHLREQSGNETSKSSFVSGNLRSIQKCVKFAKRLNHLKCINLIDLEMKLKPQVPNGSSTTDLRRSCLKKPCHQPDGDEQSPIGSRAGQLILEKSQTILQDSVIGSQDLFSQNPASQSERTNVSCSLIMNSSEISPQTNSKVLTCTDESEADTGGAFETSADELAFDSVSLFEFSLSAAELEKVTDTDNNKSGSLFSACDSVSGSSYLVGSKSEIFSEKYSYGICEGSISQYHGSEYENGSREDNPVLSPDLFGFKDLSQDLQSTPLCSVLARKLFTDKNQGNTCTCNLNT